jgi:acyl dehydratase
MFRMMYDNFIKDSSSLGSPGIEETKWLKPVRPDTPYSLRVHIIDKRVSNSRPKMGLVRLRAQLLDEAGTPVVDQTSTLLLGLRA